MPFRSDEPPAPKPYEIVEFPPNVRVERTMPEPHDRFVAGTHTGRLTLAVEALTPVHVASGLMPLVGRPPRLVRAMLRVGATPVVPGSSLKGCIRSIVEAISPACVRVTRSRQVPREFVGCARKDRLCVACRLFGAQDYQGLVRFSDLRLIGEPSAALDVALVPAFYRPRDREALYYNGGNVRGRKFYLHGSQQARGDGPIEVCRAGSRFAGTIDFANLTPAHLGLLLVGLGQADDFPLFPKLGGAKPACYGSLRVRVRLTLTDPRARYGSWDSPADTAQDTAPFLAAAPRLLLRDRLAKMAEVLRWPNDRECPAGNY